MPPLEQREHYDRWVIVASPAVECADDEVATVRVVPCSSKVQRADPRDMLIAATEPGFVVASVALLRFDQRVPKLALKDSQESLHQGFEASAVRRRCLVRSLPELASRLRPD